MPNMSRPVQQRRQVGYATKADVEILTAEVHGFREATEVEIRGFRESAKADVGVLAAEIRGLRESTEAELRAQRESTDSRLHAHGLVLERIERQIERLDRRYDDLSKQGVADHRATIRWIAGAVLALGGMLLAVLRFGRIGVG